MSCVVLDCILYSDLYRGICLRNQWTVICTTHAECLAVTEPYMLERCDKKTLRLNLQISMCVRAVLSYSYH